jgi:HD-like signal output (HDOD) protein/ActR/RegA family two-component response regulator
MPALADDTEDLPNWCVLFVDDEPHLLAALRRALRPQRGRWKMLFATSGAQALEIIEQERVDAVVSDMRMPGMDGAELLARVQTISPSTARIVLSGEADLGSVLAVARTAQQFLSKPCDAGTVVGALDRALRVQSLLNQPSLRELIGGVTSLPTLPVVYHELLAAMSSADADLPGVARIVATDVATSAELLKLVNSAFFGLPREISSIESAVTLLGLDNIQALVLAGSVFRINDALSRVMDVEMMQSQAMRRAGIARAVAAAEGWPAHERDVAVLSCMLRDLGGLILAEGLPTAAAQLSEWLGAEPDLSDPVAVAGLEQAAYGCTVAQASAYLLGLWGFSPAVVYTVATFPVSDTGPGTTRFERLLGYASLRVADPLSCVPPEPDGYLSAERLQAWDAAVEEVMAR